ncbi:Malolactic regulator [Lacticaseibacillus rhamnosus]|uniref:Malolactic regulator n=1 Tax=Lacticaseibacillus rhamnosus TaxID=47715 RepID=A0AAX0K5Y1_LACRH|nr:Malolactic regulator [Lacticaseibacillus rhamnosus]MCT3373219.1 Malolactic regulator [Lacticaseibacillus rhamnosus]ONN76137.1 Malolactic regulator [Lacticaseibacillus rhamnosus]PCL28743.1 Malolactic regulator [Lacticaseibacillus rhamnosus]PCL36587.1 Malolactic regulator [Lacticaseibacillus rhamnosus]
MAKTRPSRPRPLMFWFTPITRSPAQGSACKDLDRNGQSPAITLKAAYTPIPNRAGSRSPKKGCSCFLAGTSFLNT